MDITYRLDVNEISIDLLNSIKAAFKDKTVEMIVSDEAEIETIRTYADEDSLKFWMVWEDDIYQDCPNKTGK